MKQRRNFLGLLASIVLMPFQSAQVKAALPPLNENYRELLLLLDKTIADNPVVGKLGKSYLQLAAERQSPDKMMQRLLGPLASHESINAVRLRSHLATLRQSDFENDNLVTVDGWILAQSEADALALVMLFRSG